MFKYTREEWAKLWEQYEQDIAAEFLRTSDPVALYQVLHSARMLKVWLEGRDNVEA